MYRFLVAAFFCVAVHAAPVVAQKPPVQARASEVQAPPELIKTVSAGTRVAPDTPREKGPPKAVAATSEQQSSTPGTRDMVLAALALMVGIAVRRYGVGK